MNEKQNSFARLSIASVHCFSIIYDALVVNLSGEGNLSLTTRETEKVKSDGPDRFNLIRTSSNFNTLKSPISIEYVLGLETSKEIMLELFAIKKVFNVMKSESKLVLVNYKFQGLKIKTMKLILYFYVFWSNNVDKAQKWMDCDQSLGQRFITKDCWCYWKIIWKRCPILTTRLQGWTFSAKQSLSPFIS